MNLIKVVKGFKIDEVDASIWTLTLTDSSGNRIDIDMGDDDYLKLHKELSYRIKLIRQRKEKQAEEEREAREGSDAIS